MKGKYYAFNDKDRAITFYRHDMPCAWINYISNGTMHAFVSQAGGGFAWWQSPTIFRLSRYRVNNLPLDTPGFYIYIREKDGTVWSPTFRPCETPLDAWTSRHQPGVTSFVATKGPITATLRLFVAPDYDAVVYDLSLSNGGKKKIDLDVFAYAELQMHEMVREVCYSYYNRHQLKVWYEKEMDGLIYLYHADGLPRRDIAPLVYFGASHKSSSYCGNRDAFVGNYRDERNPVQVQKGRLGNNDLFGGEPCAALHCKVSLPASATVERSFFLGVSQGAIVDFATARNNAGLALAALRTPGAVAQQRKKNSDWWENHLGKFDCRLPDVNAQRQINTWSPVQSVQTGRYSRSISSQATGRRGLGYRDTATDMIAIAYRDPVWAANVLRYLLSLQFDDGKAIHQAWPVDNEPPEVSIRCDDHLWLPFVAYAIVSETGDLSFLEEQVAYYREDPKKEPVKASVLDHLLQGFRFTEANLGAHGLPLTLRGDWNDIIARFTYVKKGESVFCGQQYCVALRYTEDMAQAAGKPQAAAWCRELLNKQIAVIEACAWDGEWWHRAYDDDGKPVGSKSSQWGKIWLNPQSWAVFGGAGPIERLREGMANAGKYLDTEVGLKKLHPSFATYPEVSDPFSGYNLGAGENGAIFCQANPWAIIAEALLGNGKRAWKYYTQMIPHVALQHMGIDRYRAEPYAYTSNIIGPENPQFGWANVNQVTGTAAWMDLASTQFLLGIRPQIAGLRVDPCIPADWKGFSINRVYRGTRVEISVDNKARVEKGVTAITVDGAPVPFEKGVPIIPPSFFAGKSACTVKVTMGKTDISTLIV